MEINLFFIGDLATTPGVSKKDVGVTEAEVTRSLLSGNAASIASAVLDLEGVREALFLHFLDTIDHESTALCQKVSGTHFRTIPVENIQEFNWQSLIDDMSHLNRCHRNLKCLCSTSW